MSIAVTSILLVAMGGALLLTVSAADAGNDSNAAGSQASEALSRMNAELSVAASISSFSPNSIAFTVPDRDGDGLPESIAYSWSGVAGAPLKRAYNTGTPATLVAGVQSCRVAFADRPVAQLITSPEQVLQSCDSPAGASTLSFNTDTNNWATQYVRPPLPANAVSWSLTKIRLVLGQSGSATGSFYIGIRTADASLRPTSTVLGFQTISESWLPISPGWYEVAIGPITGLAPTQGICINVRGTSSSGKDCVVQYVQGSSAQPFNSHFFTTSNGGSFWTAPNDTKDMRFILYGTVTTISDP
jgi:hypothetical protein